MHCDSIGNEVEIQPGAVNWMTAGRGVVHSERTPATLRHSAKFLHGLHIWVALPAELEETEPTFTQRSSFSSPDGKHRPPDLPDVSGDEIVVLRRLSGTFAQEPSFLTNESLLSQEILPTSVLCKWVYDCAAN